MYTETLQHEVVFVHPLLKRYECPICLHAMRNPVQTECGHLFCKECLDPVLQRRRPVCPLDQEAISRVSQPIIIRRSMYHQIKVAWPGLELLVVTTLPVTLSFSSGISGQSMPKGDSLPAGLLQLQEEWVFMDWSPERSRRNIMQHVKWMYAFLPVTGEIVCK